MLENKRIYGLDMLKIILAFQVLTLHFFANGTGQVLKYATVAPWKWIAGGITTLCYPAVNCYVLISAFFLFSHNKGLTDTIKSLIRLWLAVVTYSLLGYFIVEVVIRHQFNLLNLIKRLFPIIRGKWWFFTVYFMMVLLSPYSNKLIISLSKREHKILLLIMLSACSVAPMFINWNGHLGTNYGYSLLWFFVLYLTGAYINRFCNLPNKASAVVFVKWITVYFILSIVSYCISPIMYRLGITFTQAHYNSLCTYFQAISLIWGFLHLPINSNVVKPISTISAMSMASYLFHCQEDIESILWSTINVWKYANSEKMILACIAVILGLFSVSILIEIIRIKCIKINNFENKFVKNVLKLFNAVLARI